MQITRGSEIPSQEMFGTTLSFLATPDSGATECMMLRGVVTAGSAFPEHSHDREEILYVLSGSGSYTIAGETGTVSAGDVVVIPAGALHTFASPSGGLDAVACLPSGARTFAADGSEMRL